VSLVNPFGALSTYSFLTHKPSIRGVNDKRMLPVEYNRLSEGMNDAYTVEFFVSGEGRRIPFSLPEGGKG
jgi:hypothetical protein